MSSVDVYFAVCLLYHLVVTVLRRQGSNFYQQLSSKQVSLQGFFSFVEENIISYEILRISAQWKSYICFYHAYVSLIDFTWKCSNVMLTMKDILQNVIVGFVNINWRFEWSGLDLSGLLQKLLHHISKLSQVGAACGSTQCNIVVLFSSRV